MLGGLVLCADAVTLRSCLQQANRQHRLVIANITSRVLGFASLCSSCPIGACACVRVRVYVPECWDAS